MNTSEHTKTTMDGGRNGGQNHRLAKRIGGESAAGPLDGDHGTFHFGVQNTRPGWCLLRPESAIYERRRDRGSLPSASETVRGRPISLTCKGFVR